MTTNTIFFKDPERSRAINGIVHRSTLLGSHASQAYRESSAVQSKLAPLDLWTCENQFSTGAKEHHEQGSEKGNNSTHHFTIFSDYDMDDYKGSEKNEAKTQVQNCQVSSAQAATMEHVGQLELGFGQPLIFAKYPYAEQCHGLYSAYGAQIAARMMVPLSMSADGGPIFVNPKQYNRIMRRRKKRAELEMENKVFKSRKPYLHLSRHLHAMRRARGSGGRFLNTKNTSKKDQHGEKCRPQPTGSQISEVLHSFSKGTTNSSRSISPGTEVSSHPFSLHPLQLNHHHHHHMHPSYQPFASGPNTGNYLKA